MPLVATARVIGSGMLVLAYLVTLPAFSENGPGEWSPTVALLLMSGGLAWEALTKPEGYLRDAALLMRPWDFDVADVRCPATVWVGEDDAKAMAAATWWTDRLPQAALEVAPRTTHLATLLTQWPAILRRLGTATG